jgi:hypothetical protein
VGRKEGRQREEKRGEEKNGDKGGIGAIKNYLKLLYFNDVECETLSHNS